MQSTDDVTISNTSFDSVILRIKQVMGVEKDSDVAELLDMRPGTFAQAKRRGSIPYAEIAAFCLKNGRQMDHILLGREAVDSGTSAGHGRRKGDQFAEVPLYDVEASAGHGKLAESEDVKQMLIFRNDWIHNELRVNPNDLFLITVSGDSMVPTLSAGDVALVHNQNGGPPIPGDGIYLMRFDGSLLVKRVQCLPGGKINVISDNAAYAPFTIDQAELTDHDFCALGRIVWIGRRV